MVMLQRERTKDARMGRVIAFFVGVPAIAGQQLLTLTRDLASLERSREGGGWPMELFRPRALSPT
jgi:hypothetical protein